jgi:UDP-N-acetylmuramoyl-L-alanyl-D-glutamate--2,6-diaminopimelate ligase
VKSVEKMELKRLIEGVEVKKMVGNAQKEIEGIAYHSKQIGKRFLFAAIRGMAVDGHRFIEEAVQRGAEVIVSEEEREVSNQTLLLVPNSRRALAKMGLPEPTERPPPPISWSPFLEKLGATWV